MDSVYLQEIRKTSWQQQTGIANQKWFRNIERCKQQVTSLLGKIIQYLCHLRDKKRGSTGKHWVEVAILAQVVFSWSLLVVSENYLSVEAMLQSPPVLSLGGMCFVRKLLVEWVGKDTVGACGPFDYTATTPEIV